MFQILKYSGSKFEANSIFTVDESFNSIVDLSRYLRRDKDRISMFPSENFKPCQISFSLKEKSTPLTIPILSIL